MNVVVPSTPGALGRRRGPLVAALVAVFVAAGCASAPRPSSPDPQETTAAATAAPQDPTSPMEDPSANEPPSPPPTQPAAPSLPPLPDVPVPASPGGNAEQATAEAEITEPGTLGLTRDEFVARWNEVVASDDLTLVPHGWVEGQVHDLPIYSYSFAEPPNNPAFNVLGLVAVANPDGTLRTAALAYIPPENDEEARTLAAAGPRALLEAAAGLSGDDAWAVLDIVDYFDGVTGDEEHDTSTSLPAGIRVRSIKLEAQHVVIVREANIRSTAGTSERITPVFRVINESADAICYAYLAEDADNDWGSDRLGVGRTVPPGSSFDALVTPGDYHLLLQNCDQDELFRSEAAYQVGDAGFTFTLTD